MKWLRLYQFVLVALIGSIWYLLYQDGKLATFNGHQWSIMWFLSAMAALACGIIEYSIYSIKQEVKENGTGSDA